MLCDTYYFFFQAEDGIRDDLVTGVQTCALPISRKGAAFAGDRRRRRRLFEEQRLVRRDHRRLVDVEPDLGQALRSEERRVGKECRARWSRRHKKKERKRIQHITERNEEQTPNSL